MTRRDILFRKRYKMIDNFIILLQETYFVLFFSNFKLLLLPRVMSSVSLRTRSCEGVTYISTAVKYMFYYIFSCCCHPGKLNNFSSISSRNPINQPIENYLQFILKANRVTNSDKKLPLATSN